MSKTITKPKQSAPKGKSNSGGTIRFKVGDSVKAKSGRIYLIEKFRSDGKLQGREDKEGKPFGPTRVFDPTNVTHVALATGRVSAKSASTKKKPVKKTPVPRSSTSKKSAPQSKQLVSEKKLGCLEAAAIVLGKSKEPLSCPEIMKQILEKKLWWTGGSTPHQTLSSALQREIAKKKKQSRFIKAGRGLYAINSRK